MELQVVQRSLRKQTIIDTLRSRDDWPWVKEVAPDCQKLHRHLGHMTLDDGANEALLLHCTPATKVKPIYKQSFDDRLANGHDLYGAGL